MKMFAVVAGAAAALMMTTASFATDLEVTHWWVSPGESAAVKELQKAFDADGQDKWVDGAIAGGGDTANPIIISRITGGNPMGATQMNTGRDAEQMIQAGLMLDLTDLATKEGWEKAIRPAQVFAPCHYEGKIYCVPVNIHDWMWLWLNRHVFIDNGMTVPTNWDEYVADWPKLKAAGIIPLALANGWVENGAFDVMLKSIGGPDLALKIQKDKSVDAVKSPEFRKVAEAFAAVRAVTDPATVIPNGDWSAANNEVIQGKAAGFIMGDWAQGDFQAAGKVPGEDYDCLPGLGVRAIADTSGDSFYFPKNSDPNITAAQLRLASILLDPKTQLAFNMKKGSSPVRGDVDVSQANPCMQKSLDIYNNHPENVLPSGEATLSSDTTQQLQDLVGEFFSDTSMSVDDFVSKYADIISAAD